MLNRGPHIVFVLLLLSGLTACCQTPTPARIMNLPPPITLAEQRRHLAEWQAQLPRVKATTVTAGVKFEYRDDQGHDQSQNAEGSLMLRSQDDRTDVLLRGKAFDQPVFEAGRNNSTWWFIVRLDTKTAWIGNPQQPLTWEAGAPGGSASILRADIVPDLLGLTGLNYTSARTPPRTAVMKVDDEKGTNNVLILEPSPSGPVHLAREIIIDRFTGNVIAVQLYNNDGVVMVRSELSDYKPVSVADNLVGARELPSFPRRVVVTYPAQHLTISLQFEDVTVPANISDGVFSTPPFEKEGLKIVPSD